LDENKVAATLNTKTYFLSLKRCISDKITLFTI